MAAMKKSRTDTMTQGAFAFSLVLGGASEYSADVEDALYEAGCDDALLGQRDGVLFLEFERDSTSLIDAVLSAIADVSRAKTGLWIARVEPDDLVPAAEIARRVQRSRESIRQLIHGERGPGEFPPPIANLTRRSPIWRWTEVANWFDTNYGCLAQSEVRNASDLAAINAALELQRNLRDISVVNRLWSCAPSGAQFASAAFELKTRRPTYKRVATKRKSAAKKRAR